MLVTPGFLLGMASKEVGKTDVKIVPLTTPEKIFSPLQLGIETLWR
jgi:hypothetical protein